MRLTVPKTCKLFIGGQFPRSESGRTDPLTDARGLEIANVARASRKDLRAAVEAARAAQPGWAAKTGYLKGQILYRMAEMLENRAASLAAELVRQGARPRAATAEVEAAVEFLVHCAGWSDKFQALASSVNPVASPHFNFSVPEPLGVVGIVAGAEAGLRGLVELIAPALVGGNAVVALTGAARPLSALGLAEALATADLPAGVVNLLTGRRGELLPQFASHRDLDGMWTVDASAEERRAVQLAGAESVKRLQFWEARNLPEPLQRILSAQEIKTTWHPVGM